MLSRIADNLFWMGRYIERAENTARLLHVNYLALLEAPHVMGASDLITEKWAHLLDIMESKEAFYEHYESVNGQNVPYWLALHPQNPASISSSLRFARENARALRDRISTEMWQAINMSYLHLCVEMPDVLEEDALHDYCVTAREASHLFFGIAHATLPHDEGWYFMRTGQFLERADNTLRTLQANDVYAGKRTPVQAGIEAHRDTALLKSLSAYEAFRKHYLSGLSSELIYEFLLLNDTFPRSVRYSLRLLHETIADIQRTNPDVSDNALQQASALTDLMASIEHIAQVMEYRQPGLQDLINHITKLSTTLSLTYFGYTPQESPVSQSQSQS